MLVSPMLESFKPDLSNIGLAAASTATASQRMQGRNDVNWRKRRRKQQQQLPSPLAKQQLLDDGDDDYYGAEQADLAKNLGGCLNAYAEAGDLVQVRSLLNSNVPHSSDWLGFTALHLAARNGHLAVCRCLIFHNFAADARNKVARTPLHLAAAGGHGNVASLLLDSRADPNSEDFLRNRPLHCACQGNWPAIVDLLLRAGAQPHAVNKFGQTPLQVAESLGHVACAALLSRCAPAAHHSVAVPRPAVSQPVVSEAELAASSLVVPDGCHWPGIEGVEDPDLGLLADLGQIDFEQPAQSTPSLDADEDSPVSSATSDCGAGLELRQRLQDLANQGNGDPLCLWLPADCSVAQVPAHLSSLGLRVTARHGAALLAWFLDTDGAVVNLRATYEESAGGAGPRLTLSAFRVDCQLLEHLQSGCES